ncbi:hypothetical protein KUCAC02_016592 [Chaenocephalus aceratus]|nr:hypothetical protein KUCAC02_016592 [Chaenocephalus aceratus]
MHPASASFIYSPKSIKTLPPGPFPLQFLPADPSYLTAAAPPYNTSQSPDPWSFPPKPICFTIDIDSLYTNINTDLGLLSVTSILAKYPDHKRPGQALTFPTLPLP